MEALPSPSPETVTEKEKQQPQQPTKRTFKKSTIIKEGQDRLKSDKERHYVDKKSFYDALVERHNGIQKARAEGVPEPRVSDYIGDCIIKICTNLARKYQFSGYSFKDEMVADAIVHCLKYIDAFNIEKSENPFSYFTQAAYYQFLKRIEIEKTQTYVRCKSTMGSAVLGEIAEYDTASNAEHSLDNLEIDTNFMDSFISDFETKLSAKDQDKSEKLAEKKRQNSDDKSTAPVNKNSLEYLMMTDE